MHPGAIAALIIALSFTFFELYTVKRSAYRMEATYILQKYASALHGARLCGAPSEAQMDRFAEKYTGIERRARKSVQSDHPDFDQARVDAAMATLEREAKQSAAAVVETHGCDHSATRKLLVSFEMRAR